MGGPRSGQSHNDFSLANAVIDVCSVLVKYSLSDYYSRILGRDLSFRAHVSVASGLPFCRNFYMQRATDALELYYLEWFPPAVDADRRDGVGYLMTITYTIGQRTLRRKNKTTFSNDK